MSHVQQHFLDYSLVSKDLVRLRDGARVLGLQVWEKKWYSPMEMRKSNSGNP